MIQKKWAQLYQCILGKESEEQYQKEYFDKECLRQMNILAILFLLSFQIMIMLSVEYSAIYSSYRVIICTVISIILNLFCISHLNHSIIKFREFYFASLAVLWVGAYFSSIDKLSEQILLKSIIIMEVQLYFCFFVVNYKSNMRTIILVLGYVRIFIGFRLNDDGGITKDGIIGLIFFILSFIFLIYFFQIVKQNNKICNLTKNKEQLRFMELEKIINNDIQQGIMIVTPKTQESILSVDDLKVKYVNNCFLNQFNVTRSEDALHILPLIYASSIKRMEDCGDKNRFPQKDSLQQRQQQQNNELDDEKKGQNLVVRQEDTHDISPKVAKISSTQKNSTQLKQNKMNQSATGREYNQLNEVPCHEGPIKTADFSKLMQRDEGEDMVHSLPPQIKGKQKQNNEANNNSNSNNNSTQNMVHSFNSIQGEHNSHNILLSFNKTASQEQNGKQKLSPENAVSIHNNNQLSPERELIPQLPFQKNDYQFNGRDQNFFKSMNMNQSLGAQFNEIVINTNKLTSKQSTPGVILREGSNKNIHQVSSRTRVESQTKNKRNSQSNTPIIGSEGIITLLDRINHYHYKYLQYKDKNLSFSQRNDDQMYNQSLVIWEYKKEEKIQSQDLKKRLSNFHGQINITNGNQGRENNEHQRSKSQQQNTSVNIVSKYQKQIDVVFSNLDQQQENLQQKSNTKRSIEGANHNLKSFDKINNNQIQLNNIKKQQIYSNPKIHLNNSENGNRFSVEDNQQYVDHEMTNISNHVPFILRSEKGQSGIENQITLNANHKLNNNNDSQIKIEKQDDKLQQPSQIQQSYQNASITPSMFQKKSPARKQSTQTIIHQENMETNYNNNMRTLSMSHKPTNTTTTFMNNQQENSKPSISQQNVSLSKSKRRLSTNNHNLIAKKIDENILEITREFRGKSGDHWMDQGEQREKISRVDDDDDDEEGDDRQYLEIKLFECEMDKEESIMVIVNNINQRIKYERLKEIQTKNDQMLANVTHDLKTPLNCMTLMVEGMKLDKQYNEVTINMILENANLLMCLIQDILDYSQIKKGKLRLVQSHFYVSEIIQEVINLFQMQADQKNIKLISNISRSSSSIVNTSSNYNNNNNNQNTNQYSAQNVNSNTNLTIASQYHPLLGTRNHTNSLLTNNEMLSLMTPNDQTKNILMHQDKNRIKQILINLISNALKFTTDGYIEIKCEVKDMEEHSNIKIVEFSVKDTGVGMNPHIKSQLFKMFNTFDQKGLNKNGIGLGLTICKRLVTFLGPSDHIDVESEVSKGSTFKFKVFKDLRDIENTHHSFSEESDESPDINSKYMYHDIAKSIKLNAQYKDEDQVEDSQIIVNSVPYSSIRPNIKQLYDKDYQNKNDFSPNTPELEQSVQTKYTMLIVDDQPFNIVAFKIILKNYKQIAITEAYNGRDAFEKYQRQRYDFILMDYNMPIMNGYESTKLIRYYEKQNNIQPTKIIIVSGFDEKQKEYQKAMQGGADDFVTKPVNFKIITEKLNNYMGNSN